MLILSRKESESIVIGGNIEVCIVEIRGDKVRLGIEAPKEIPVDRHEVHVAKLAATQRANDEAQKGSDEP